MFRDNVSLRDISGALSCQYKSLTPRAVKKIAAHKTASRTRVALVLVSCAVSHALAPLASPLGSVGVDRGIDGS